MVASEINRVIQSLELDRFPTHSEIEKFNENKSLTVKISKSGGTKYLASKLGYVVKNCESEFGDYFERYTINDIHKHTGLKGYEYHSFSLEKRESTCDIYILYCLNNNNEIYKTVIIPSCHVYGQTQIGISAYGNSKCINIKIGGSGLIDIMIFTENWRVV